MISPMHTIGWVDELSRFSQSETRRLFHREFCVCVGRGIYYLHACVRLNGNQFIRGINQLIHAAIGRFIALAYGSWKSLICSRAAFGEPII